MDCYGIDDVNYMEVVAYLTSKNKRRRIGDWIKLLLQKSGASDEQYETVSSLLNWERRPRTLMGPLPWVTAISKSTRDCLISWLKKLGSDRKQGPNAKMFFGSLIRDLQIEDADRKHIVSRLSDVLAETRIGSKWRSEIFRQVYKPINLSAERIYQWHSLGTKCGIRIRVLERIVTGMRHKCISDGPQLVSLEERLQILEETPANEEENGNIEEEKLSPDEVAQLDISLEAISQDKAKKLRQFDTTRRKNYRLDESEDARIIRRTKNANRMASFRAGPLRVDSPKHNNGCCQRTESIEQAVERKRKDAERKRKMRKTETIDAKNERCRLEGIQRRYTVTRRNVEEANAKLRHQAIEKGEEPKDIYGTSIYGYMYLIKDVNM